MNIVALVAAAIRQVSREAKYSTPQEVQGSPESWGDSETAMRKYRRHRASRNAMASASRRTNRRLS